MESNEDSPKTLTNGSAWAAIVAVSIACLVLGLLIDLAEAFPPVSKALNFYNPTGDLSGKTIVTVIVWVIVWTLLHARWKNRSIQMTGKMLVVVLVLVILGLIAVFPPFFSLFAAQ
jgi:hypothetical protein